MVLEMFPKGFGEVISVDTPLWFCREDRYVMAYGSTAERFRVLAPKKVILTCMSLLFVIISTGVLLYLDLIYDGSIDLLVVVGAIAIGITIGKTTSVWEMWKSIGGTGPLGRRYHKHLCPICMSRW
jgi:hypothetical protein